MAGSARSPEETKVRRQKIFIAAGGLVLLALAGFELPGLLSSSGSGAQRSATPAATPAVSSAGVATPATTPEPRSVARLRARDLFVPQVTAPGATPAAGTGRIPTPPHVRSTGFVVKDMFVAQITPPAASTVSSTVIKTAHGTTHVSASVGGGGYIVVLGSIPGVGRSSQQLAAHAVVAAKNAGLKNVVANDAVPGQSGSGPHFTIYTGPWTSSGLAQNELIRALRNGYPHAQAQQLPTSSGKGF
jgi:hypothetical protein